MPYSWIITFINNKYLKSSNNYCTQLNILSLCGVFLPFKASLDINLIIIKFCEEEGWHKCKLDALRWYSWIITFAKRSSNHPIIIV